VSHHRLDGKKTEILALGTENCTDRDSSGRFLPGNRSSPGRPRRQVEVDYLANLADVVPSDTWRKITERAVQDALAGEYKARDWLSKYLLGESSRLEQLAKEEHDSQAKTHDFTKLTLEELLLLESLFEKATNIPGALPFPETLSTLEAAKLVTMLGPPENMSMTEFDEHVGNRQVT